MALQLHVNSKYIRPSRFLFGCLPRTSINQSTLCCCFFLFLFSKMSTIGALVPISSIVQSSVCKGTLSYFFLKEQT